MIIEKITGLGFDNVKKIPVSQIPFEPSLISLCEMNTCGNYKRCYTCPPYVGKTEELVAKAKSYDEIIVFQKIYRLEDSFDIEGIKREGYKLTTPMIVCNTSDYELVKPVAKGNIEVGSRVIELK